MSTAVLAAVLSAVAVWWLVPPAGLSRLPGRGDRGAWRRWRDAVKAWLIATRGRVSRADVRRRRECETSVPVVCELLAICVAAGAPPRGALAVVAESLGGVVGVELARVVKRIELGVAEPEAWLTLRETPGYRAVARDIARTVGSGAGLENLLRRHAEDALRDAESAAMTRARGAGVQAMIPLVVCFLPAFLLVGVVPALVSVVLAFLR